MSKSVAGTLNVETKNPVCPPLTTGDIVTLRGKPMVKIIKPGNKNAGRELRLTQKEEWVYLSIQDNSNEHYFFDGEHLVGWKKTKR
ncbi:MAG: hypothetical protein HY811_03755 [Planctomycetes bacterium]|nr:hypothetical protein [Planctomycetota bacterium]